MSKAKELRIIAEDIKILPENQKVSEEGGACTIF
jgi:hypothetical protein